MVCQDHQQEVLPQTENKNGYVGGDAHIAPIIYLGQMWVSAPTIVGGRIFFAHMFNYYRSYRLHLQYSLHIRTL